MSMVAPLASMPTQLLSNSFVTLHIYRHSVIVESKSIIEVVIEIIHMLKQDSEMHTPLAEAGIVPLLAICLLNHHHSSAIKAWENIATTLLNLSNSICKMLICTPSILDALVVALNLLSPT